jgi:hypothetical protein
VGILGIDAMKRSKNAGMPAVVQDYGDLIAAYQRAREKRDGERMRQIRSKAEAVLGVMNAATERLALKTFGSIE